MHDMRPKPLGGASSARLITSLSIGTQRLGICRPHGETQTMRLAEYGSDAYDPLYGSDDERCALDLDGV